MSWFPSRSEKHTDVTSENAECYHHYRGNNNRYNHSLCSMQYYMWDLSLTFLFVVLAKVEIGLSCNVLAISGKIFVHFRRIKHGFSDYPLARGYSPANPKRTLFSRLRIGLLLSSSCVMSVRIHFVVMTCANWFSGFCWPHSQSKAFVRFSNNPYLCFDLLHKITRLNSQKKTLGNRKDIRESISSLTWHCACNLSLPLSSFESK